MTTVVSVLKSGGWCGPDDVLRMQARLQTYCGEHRFVCLTDMDVPGVETIPLAHGWAGWWSKIELFRPGLFAGSVLYLDLDAIVVGDVLHMARGPFAMVRDFYHPARGQSCVMAWAEPPTTIYSDFASNPEAYSDCYRRGGDQAYIASCVTPEYLQDRHPGEIVSWKVHCRSGIPPTARIVDFHGRPKPADLNPTEKASLSL